MTRLTSGENLVQNPGFEIGSGLFPDGWRWSQRNTGACCTVSTDRPHSGKLALHFTNFTSKANNVYGVLFRPDPITLVEGRRYTLSAWVRSKAPGAAWLGCWADQEHALKVPATDDQWRRIAYSFVATPALCRYYIVLVTESPTTGLWVDDVKLEEGGAPTPDLPADGVHLDAVTAASTVSTDRPIPVDWEVTTAQPLPDVMAIAEVEPLHRTFAARVAFAAGASQLSLRLPTCHGAGRQVVSLKLLQPGRQLAEARLPMYFRSEVELQRRLSALQRAVVPYRKLQAAIARYNRSVDAASVALAVIERCGPLVADDIAQGDLERASAELAELVQIARPLQQRGRLRRWTALGRSFGAPRRMLPLGPTHPSGIRRSASRRSDGRQVFEIGYGHFGQVRQDVEWFPRLGVNLIQVEVGPKDLFPRQGELDRHPIERLRHLLQRARRAGVAVDLLVSPHYLPDWMLDAYPELRRRREGFLQNCLHAPAGQLFLRRYLQTLLAPLRGESALHSICLTNEPVNLEEPCPDGERAWRAWLKSGHGDLGELNRCWGSRYSSWDTVPTPNPLDPAVANHPTPLWMDWVRFNQEWFTNWHGLLAAEVHRWLPGIPVHVKATTWSMTHTGEVRFGMDPTCLAAVTDLNGHDSQNYFGYGEQPFAQDWLSSLYACDLQRSIRDASIFDSENHLIPDRETRPVPPAHLRAALWQEALHGQRMTTLWVWERRRDPQDALYGSILQRPACIAAVGQTCLDLNRLAHPITALQRQPAQVLLLEGTATKVWDGDVARACSEQLYTALSFMGVRVGFVTERQLEAGRVPQARVLFLPNITHLSAAAVTTLARYKGHLVRVGPATPVRDEYDREQAIHLTDETLIWNPAQGKWDDLWQAISEHLDVWGDPSHLSLQDASGRPISGVAWLAAPHGRGYLVNLCNYENHSVRYQLRFGKAALVEQDLLTGARLGTTVNLAPLQVRLVYAHQPLHRPQQ